ncbi:MAG: glycine zipper family protein [Rhodospirillales bacterium]|nr:glycine zipper family protein [Rhodospirillales bacterium]
MRRLLAALLMLVATGCSSDPIVDMKGVDPARYDNDLAECEQYADQVSVGRSAAGGALFGGAAGAAVGAAVGAVTGRPGSGAAIGGAGGGTSGLFGGAASGSSKQQRVVRNCLRGRGYKVLD